MCAGIGIEAFVRHITQRRRRALIVLFILWGAAMISWMGERLYLQIDGIRNSPQLYTELVLKETERLKPFTKWMFASDPIYSFHAGIPMPPDFAVLSLKRFWSGQMSNERVAEEMRTFKPGLILLANDAREWPFNDLLQTEYRLIYQDGSHNLYAHKSVLKSARQ